MTNRKAPESVCRDLCEAVIHYGIWPKVLEPHVESYRAATAPLRTRQEVDAEIANLCRDKVTLPRPIDLDEVSRISKRIEELCREPTADEPEKARSRRECGDCGLLYEGDECPAHEPEACGCEETEALKRKLQHVREICGRYGASCCAGDMLTVLDGA